MKSHDIKKNKWMRDIERTTGFFHGEALSNLKLKIAFFTLLMCDLGTLK